MAKILHGPLQVSGSEQIGQEKGFREVFGDENYKQFDFLRLEGELGKGAMNSSLYGTIADWKPDILWAQLQDTASIQPQMLEKIRQDFPNLWLTQWNGDIREVVPVYQSQIGRYFDITYLGFDHQKIYTPHAKRVEIMMIAVDPDEVTIEPQAKEYDVVFIGNHYDNQFPDTKLRLRLMQVLKEHFNTLVLGNGWPEGISSGSCPVKEQGKWYAKGKTCISINHFNNIKYYSERLLWCLASGTPTIAFKTPELEFEDGVHYLGFSDVDECVRHVRNVLKEDFDTTKAVEEVITNHNWTRRAEQVRRDYEQH